MWLIIFPAQSSLQPSVTTLHSNNDSEAFFVCVWIKPFILILSTTKYYMMMQNNSCKQIWLFLIVFKFATENGKYKYVHSFVVFSFKKDSKHIIALVA